MHFDVDVGGEVQDRKVAEIDGNFEHCEQIHVIDRDDQIGSLLEQD